MKILVEMTEDEALAFLKNRESPKEPIPFFTLSQVRAELAGLSAQGKGPQIKNALNSLGADRLSDLPESLYSELMEKVKGL